MTTVYSPGDWTALTQPDGWALVQVPITDPRVQGMWAALSTSAEAAIDVLLDGRLADLPAFVLVRNEGDRLHAMIRGDGELGQLVGARDRRRHPARLLRRPHRRAPR